MREPPLYVSRGGQDHRRGALMRGTGAPIPCRNDFGLLPCRPLAPSSPVALCSGPGGRVWRAGGRGVTRAVAMRTYCLIGEKGGCMIDRGKEDG